MGRPTRGSISSVRDAFDRRVPRISRSIRASNPRESDRRGARFEYISAAAARLPTRRGPFVRRARLGDSREKKPSDPSRPVLTARRAFDRDRFTDADARFGFETVSRPDRLDRDSRENRSRDRRTRGNDGYFRDRPFRFQATKKRIFVRLKSHTPRPESREKSTGRPRRFPKGIVCCVLRRFAAFFPSL